MRIRGAKLQAEGKDGELGDGTLHSLLVKKLLACQLENYSRLFKERARVRSVTAFRDWLKDKVRFRTEAVEMANGIEPNTFEHVRPLRAPKYPDLSRVRNFHTAVIGNGIKTCGLPVLYIRVLIVACGSAISFTTKEWMTAGSAPKKGSFAVTA